MTSWRLNATKLLFVSALLAGVASVYAEPEGLPQNIIDPNLPIDTRATQVDASLPFIHLEPHDFCFDVNEPVLVTIYAINLSKGRLTIDWDAIARGLVFESLRAGTSNPQKDVAPIMAKSEIERFTLASHTVDLKSYFEIKVPSVYRLQYIQPLKDGRLHFCNPVQFIIEDDAEVDRLVSTTWPEEHAIRPIIAELLKANPLFVKGNGPKTYGWDDLNPEGNPERRTAKWDKAFHSAAKLWQNKLPRISDEIAQADRIRAMNVILDRSMLLSNKFASLLPSDINFISKVLRPEQDWPRGEQVRFLLKLMESRDSWVVGNSMNGVSGYTIRSQETVPALIKIADGTDKKLASKALSCLGNYDRDATIIAFLRRKMTDSDQELALHAAITTCYSGDWSGFPMLLRYVSHESPKLREQAIAQLGDPRFRRYQDQVVPLILKRLSAEKDASLIERSIETLGSYPSKETLTAIAPFQKHENKQVRLRAALVGETLSRELSKKNDK